VALGFKHKLRPSLTALALVLVST